MENGSSIHRLRNIGNKSWRELPAEQSSFLGRTGILAEIKRGRASPVVPPICLRQARGDNQFHGEHANLAGQSPRALYAFDVADYESVAASRWVGERWADKSRNKGFTLLQDELSRAELLSSQVDSRTRRLEFGRHPDQVGEGIRFHFLHHLPAVCLYGDFADSELAANLLIQQTSDD